MKAILILIISFCFVINTSAQQVSLTQQIKARKVIEDYCKLLIEYANGDTGSRFLIDDLMEGSNNQVYNDIDDNGNIEMESYLSLITLKKPTINYSEIPAEEEWQIGKNDRWQGLVIKVEKRVNGMLKSNYFLINTRNNRITNIYKTLPPFLTYKNLYDDDKMTTVKEEKTSVGGIFAFMSGSLFLEKTEHEQLLKLDETITLRQKSLVKKTLIDYSIALEKYVNKELESRFIIEQLFESELNQVYDDINGMTMLPLSEYLDKIRLTKKRSLIRFIGDPTIMYYFEKEGMQFGNKTTFVYFVCKFSKKINNKTSNLFYVVNSTNNYKLVSSHKDVADISNMILENK